jgi:hypothetical protein
MSLHSNGTFLSIALIVGAVLLSSSAAAEFSKREKHLNNFEPVAQSNAKDMAANHICRYVSRGVRVDTTAPQPAIFKNIKGIYIGATISGHHSPAFEKAPVIESGDLAQLAECTITKYFKRNDADARASPVPVHIPNSSVPLVDWPETKQDGRLVVSVQLDLRDDGDAAYHGLFHDRLVLVHAGYFRHDINDIQSLAHQCATAFPYTDNPDRFLRLLTIAMRQCLYQPFSSSNGSK